MDHENVKHGCPFPSVPRGHLGLGGKTWEGEAKKKGEEKQVGGPFSMGSYSFSP